ncbi:cytochrome protein [Pyrenochaeta sp. MPI-SDFR-AT-0127]|nr:cytochrome protein [Pyrenochaeta sp. MPI-SDFR-AT-0127]
MHILILAPALVLLAGFLKKLVALAQQLTSPLCLVPGPWHSKWTSAVLDYYWLRGRRAQYVQQLHEKYGRVVRLSPREVDFSSVTASKQIHSYNRPLLKGEMYDMFRTGNGYYNVFSTRDPVIHARDRRLLSAAMTEASLKGIEELVHEKAGLMIDKIGLEMKKNGMADVMKWSMFYTTDVIGELTFGDSFRMLEQGKVNQYAYDLQQLGGQIGIRVAFPTIVKLASYLPIPLFSEAAAAIRRLISYADESIRRYEKMILVEPDNPKLTLFTKLFRVGEETISRAEIVANAQAYIVAGSDTTAHSLTYLLWAVCRDESIKKRLVAEVEALPTGYQDEDLKSLPYLNHVIQETLRCYAAAPGMLPRDVPQDGCEIDGYWMPGGTVVQTQAYSMHRDATVYPEPERFNPSRWESASKEMKDAWMPFGGGARICLGLHLAQMELRLATTKFFRAFPNARLSTLGNFCDDDMEQVIYFLMYPKSKRCLIQTS